MTDEPRQVPIVHQINLPTEQEVGTHADFVSIWHTPSTFVLDFVAVKQPPHPAKAAQTDAAQGRPVLEATVASRVRIPSEQIFPLIEALQKQGQAWLRETGRTEPPSSWFHTEPGA